MQGDDPLAGVLTHDEWAALLTAARAVLRAGERTGRPLNREDVLRSAMTKAEQVLGVGNGQ
jgi:cob(I)alamin adenosyltransferase